MNVEHSKFDHNDDTQVASGSKGPSVTLIGLGVVIILFVVFFLQNGEHQTIDFLVFEKRTTIRWSLLVAMILGVLADRGFSMWWRRRKRNDD